MKAVLKAQTKGVAKNDYQRIEKSCDSKDCKKSVITQVPAYFEQV